jgi:hypothetical protein
MNEFHIDLYYNLWIRHFPPFSQRLKTIVETLEPLSLRFNLPVW